MTRDSYQEFPCDLCGSTEAVELPHVREYGDPVHICTNCGLVYVRMRRSSAQIADDWSHKIFGEGYSATFPPVKGRLTFVADFIDASLGMEGKKVCDIGAGEGYFLNKAQKEYGAAVFGVEPSAANCSTLKKMGIECFQGTIQEYQDTLNTTGRSPEMDFATMMWTIEASQSPREMLTGAHQILKDGGHIVIATGSRILVPFKKALYNYISKNPGDTHPLRFSFNTLKGILAVSGFEMTHVSRYMDSDVLCMIARKVPQGSKVDWQGDNYLDVYNFFERWHVETQIYYPQDEG